MTNAAIDFSARNDARQGKSIGEFIANIVLAVRATFGAARSAHEEALRDASSVRSMAHRYRQTDRGFAADLDAAADRHEESLARVSAARR